MHFIRIIFKSRFVIWLNVLLLICKPLFLADILGSSISVSWRRLLFSCVRFVLLRPDRSLFRFQLYPSVLYFLTDFQMADLVDGFFSRKRFFKELMNLLKLLVLKYFVTTKIRFSLVSCILGILKNEWINLSRSWFIYILMVSRLLNNIRETVITFQVN